MSDLAKAGTPSAGMLARFVSEVPPETRKMVAAAMAWFGDKPMQQGLDEVIMVQKLTLLIHEGGYTPAQVMRAMRKLDISERFRPGVSEWSVALREERRVDLMIEKQAREEAYRAGGHELPDEVKAEISERIAEVRRKLYMGGC